MSEVTMTCDVCLLTGGPFSAAEAAVHVVTHNLLHHRGAPIALATAVSPVGQLAA